MSKVRIICHARRLSTVLAFPDEYATAEHECYGWPGDMLAGATFEVGLTAEEVARRRSACVEVARYVEAKR